MTTHSIARNSHRIAPPEPAYVHDIAIWWLNELITDLKLLRHDIAAVSADGERLAHWALIHHKEIACCHHDVLGRIREGAPHKQALAFFDALVEDVKAGKPIDGARLHSASVYVHHLMNCREDWIKY